MTEEETRRFKDKDERVKYNVKMREEVRSEIEDRILGCGAACALDDDEREQTATLHTRVKTVFGLPPIVFAKPF